MSKSRENEEAVSVFAAGSLLLLAALARSRSYCQPNIELVGAPALTGAKSLGSRQNKRVMSDA
jgi:hypothetical protein